VNKPRKYSDPVKQTAVEGLTAAQRRENREAKSNHRKPRQFWLDDSPEVFKTVEDVEELARMIDAKIAARKTLPSEDGNS
jgi:hypothetical protein